MPARQASLSLRHTSRIRFPLLAVLCAALAPALTGAQHFNPALYQGLRWRCIGPFRAGRTVAIAGIPEQPNIFYAAAVNGGIWQTDDYGRTWRPIFDAQPTQSIGAIAIAPSNPKIIYAGSGEGLQRPDLATGDGIYKSTDGGQTWTHLGLRDGQQIPAIIVDPRDPNRLFVAVLGHPYGPNSERGVFRSLDGGRSWQKVLYKDENTGAVDLAFDPADAQTIYAVLWAARRTPWETGLRGRTNGLFKSTDGGNTWTPLTKGLPANDQGLGRIGIALAPGDSQRMYALVDAPRLGGLFRSDDAGENWHRVNTEMRIWGRGDDFAWVRVAPDNPDRVYVCNTSTYRSDDAGGTFTAIKGAPGGDDYHSIWINPRDPRILFLGSDQGATISVNGGRTWSSWYNQPTAQFFHVITDNQFPYWVYAGQQESGSAGTASRGDGGEITFRDWHPVGAEEYGYIAPDPLHPYWIFGGKVTRFDSRTGQTKDVSPTAEPAYSSALASKYRFVRTAPLVFSPADPRALYLGSNVLFKTTDGGQTWQVVSPDLSRQNPDVPANLESLSMDNPARDEHRGEIYALAPSPLEAKVVWAGTDDGLIWITRDAGAHWNNVTPPDLTPWSKVAQLDASHFDSETAYAAVNRFRLDDLRPYIYRTRDGGKTWRKIVDGLPDNASVNVVREDPVRRGLLFAGTERAVYVSFDGGDSWQSLQLNLPPTSMRDLVIHGDDLVVGTHGRSFWILDDITPLRQLTSEVAGSDAYLFKPQLTYRMRRNVNTDTPLPPETPAGQNPPAGAALDYVLAGADAGQTVKLEILDSGGRVLRAFSSSDKPEVTPNDVKETLNVPLYWVRWPHALEAGRGMHRFIWDLRLASPRSIRHEYPISAIPGDTPRDPRGPLVPPGSYTVRLTAGARTHEQPLTVKMDPRVAASTAGLAAQYALASKICAAMNTSYDSLQEVRGIRQQLQAIGQQAGKQGAPGGLAGEVAGLDHRLTEFEGAPRRPQPGPSAPASFSQLNNQLYDLLAAVDGADGAPTEAQQRAASEALRDTAMLYAEWIHVQTRDILPLNSRLQAAGLPKIKFVPATGAPAQAPAE